MLPPGPPWRPPAPASARIVPATTIRDTASMAFAARNEIAPPPVPPGLLVVVGWPAPPLPSSNGVVIEPYGTLVVPVTIVPPRPPCEPAASVAPPATMFPTVRPTGESLLVPLPSGFTPQPPR